MRILFICRGNVARSQMAEAIFKKLTNNKHTAESAGVEAMGSDGTDLSGMVLKDRASSKYAIDVMKEIDIDIANNRIKRLTPDMVKNADTIIAIIKPESSPQFLKDSGKVTYWNIVDPDEQGLEFYRKTRDEIKKRVIELVDSI